MVTLATITMKRNVIPLIILTGLLIVFDQLSKWAAQIYLSIPLRIIPGFFELTYVKNQGIAFGLKIWPTVLLGLIPIILLVSVYFFYKELNMAQPLSVLILSLILSGGLSNMIDRLRFGWVIDFISIWRYPVFNVADVYVTVGVGLLMVFYKRIQRVSS